MSTEQTQINWAAKMLEQWERTNAEILAALSPVVADLVVDEVTTTIEVEIPPIVLPGLDRAEDKWVCTGVKAEITRSPKPRSEREADGSVEVHGFGRPAKKDGTPDRRYDGDWYHRLPEELAGPLLLAAFARSPFTEETTP